MGEPIPEELKSPHIDGMALDAIRLISAMDTQWHYIQTGFGSIRKGLDYNALEVVARFKKIKLGSDLFEIIAMLEKKIIKITGDRHGSS